jgi:hypothetical protein
VSGWRDVDGTMVMAGGWGAEACAAHAILQLFDAHEGYIRDRKPLLHRLARLSDDAGPGAIRARENAKRAIDLLKEAADILDPGCVLSAERCAEDKLKHAEYRAD